MDWSTLTKYMNEVYNFGGKLMYEKFWEMIQEEYMHPDACMVADFLSSISENTQQINVPALMDIAQSDLLWRDRTNMLDTIEEMEHLLEGCDNSEEGKARKQNEMKKLLIASKANLKLNIQILKGIFSPNVQTF